MMSKATLFAMATALQAAAVVAEKCKASGTTEGLKVLKGQARDLLVKADGTSLEGTTDKWFAQAKVDEIDRFLTVGMELPATTIDGTGFFSKKESLCDRKWTCPAQDYEVCPGQSLTTTQFRDFTDDTVEGHAQPSKGRPVFDFDATAGKTYSLIMVDLLSKSFADIGASVGIANTCFFHYFAFNIANAGELNQLSGLSTEDQEPLGPLQGAGNLNPKAPNSYTFLLFEHDAILDFNRTAVKEFFGGCQLQDVLDTTGLASASLRSFSYFQGVAAATARFAALEGGLADVVEGVFDFTCDSLKDKPEDMCTLGSDETNAAVGVSTSIAASLVSFMATAFLLK